MASDRQQYRDAVKKWRHLRREGKFSVNPEDGGEVAILVARAQPTEDVDEIPQQALDKYGDLEIEEFAKEADAVAEHYEAQSRIVSVIGRASLDDVRNTIKDREVSDMVFIGHGTLSTFLIEGSCREDDFRYRWRDAAEDATHLKLGKIVQRTCGILTANLNVPLGAFVASSHSNVLAAPGVTFEPTDLGDSINQLLHPVTNKTCMSYKDIKTNFPRPQ